MNKHDVDIISSADAVAAMEAAKRIIGAGDGDSATLADIVTDGTKSEWSRIAAIYVLGFVNDDLSGATLVDILKDRSENDACRAHAAEALSIVRHPDAISIMESILTSATESTEVKQWCVFALSQIGGVRACAILQRLADTGPKGELATELREAFRCQKRI
jgi:HEAT repeat protein